MHCDNICVQVCIPSSVAMHSPGQLPFHKCEQFLGMLEQARHQVALSIIKDREEKRGLLLSVCRVRYAAQQFIHTFAFTDRCFSLTVLLATLHSSNVREMHFRVGCQLSHFCTPNQFYSRCFFSSVDLQRCHSCKPEEVWAALPMYEVQLQECGQRAPWPAVWQIAHSIVGRQILQCLLRAGSCFGTLCIDQCDPAV